MLLPDVVVSVCDVVVSLCDVVVSLCVSVSVDVVVSLGQPRLITKVPLSVAPSTEAVIDPSAKVVVVPCHALSPPRA